MFTQEKHKPTAKVWLEYKGKPILGEGGATILGSINKERSISKAAKKNGMSYRYVWNYLANIGEALGESVVKTFKGGKGGGGGAKLTLLGEKLLNEYQRVEGYVGEILGDEEYWEAIGLKISARNRLEGTVKEVEKGEIVAKIKIEITLPATITAVISSEAVGDLNLQVGEKVEAVVKATEVMVAKKSNL
jgi:molybdate transport system regulatory protein